MDDERKDLPVDEPVDLERSRLLLVWLQARRAVDHCLSDLLAAGPAGERRVRERLAHVDDLETRARQAFVNYRKAASTATSAAARSAGTATAAAVAGGVAASTPPPRDWTGSAPTAPTAPPRLDLVQTDLGPSDLGQPDRGQPEPGDAAIDFLEIGRPASRGARGHR